MAVKIERKQKVQAGIPTASLPDIIFMLLIFFMVSTQLRQYTGLRVSLPAAKMVEKLPSKQHQSTIWVDRKNNVVIDDFTVNEINELRNIVYQKLSNDPRLVVVLKVDKNSEMGRLIDVQQELRAANALRVVYSAVPL
ncbi:MAG: biopolymer transporter ExbD [Calditrichia bacterium]